MKKYISIAIVLLNTGCAESPTTDEILFLQGSIYGKGTGRDSYLVIEDKKSSQSYKIQNYQKFHLEKHKREVLKLKAKLIEKSKGPWRPAIIEVLEIKN